MRRKLYDMKNTRAELLKNAEDALNSKDMETYNSKMAEITAMNADIEALENLVAETGRFEKNEVEFLTLNQVQEAKKEEDATTNKLDAARTGNEYVNAWADALKNGVNIKTGQSVEACAPLYNALTIGGGSPAGADGGFLVPIEFDNMIHRKLKEFIRLADFFKVETVSGLTGWRALEKGKANQPLPNIDETETITPTDQPAFIKVPYAVKKYGDIIIVSSELTDDNTAGLMQYLVEWFAPKIVLTENSLLLELLDGLTAIDIAAGSEIKQLKSALNKGLNTAYSKRASLICNQDSYDTLDQMVDTTGRGMLVPDPTQPDVFRFKARRVANADNDLIPSTETRAPIFIGDYNAFGTLFRRKALEFASTNIGGSAWRTDTTEMRGIVRMDAQRMDEAAAIKRTVVITE